MCPVRRGKTARKFQRWVLSAVAVVAVLLLARWTGDGYSDSASTELADTEQIELAELAKNSTRHAGQQRDAAQIDTEPSHLPVHDEPADFALERPPEEATGDDDELAPDPVESIYLDPLIPVEGGPTLALTGFDPFAPRELVAWRILHGRAVVMTRGSSDAGGEIHFPEVLAPRDGFEVVISEAGFRPESVDASPRRRLAPRAPVAPYAQVSRTPGEYQLRIVPTETTGAVLLGDISGNTFASFDIPNEPEPSNRVLYVALTLPSTDTEVWMAHRLHDGRVSEWRSVSLPPPDADLPDEG
jgi:hypothetical protein